MRGNDERIQEGMFSYMALEDRIPATHPLRKVRKVTDLVLTSMTAEFDAMHSAVDRPSIPPERLPPCPAAPSLLHHPQ